MGYDGRFSIDYIQYQSMALCAHGVRRQHVQEAEDIIAAVVAPLIKAANRKTLGTLTKQSVTMSPQAMLMLMKFACAGANVYCEAMPEDTPCFDDLAALSNELRAKLEDDGIGPQNWITS